MRHTLLALVITLVAAASTARSADASSCTLAHSATAIEYWTKTNPVADSTRCDWTNGNPSCHWYGWLWKGPAENSNSAGKLPLVLYIHGSGQTKGRSSICEIVNTLVPLGYAVFMPYMRGVDDTSTSGTGHGFKNTGKYIEDYAAAGGATGDQKVLNTLSYMEWMAQDEGQFALDKIMTLKSGDGTKPLVDSTKIALWGHSYGGAVVNIATGTGLSPQPAATINLSGAVMSWGGSPYWSIYMMSYAGTAKNAIYFQQNLNESPSKSIDSTLIPFKAADAASVVTEMRVFQSINPDADTQVTCDTNGYPDYQCNHVSFNGDSKFVKRWIPSAIEFMSRQGVK